MKTERVPIGSLTLDPGNVRRHGDRNLAAIRRSLERWGQQKPIIVDSNNMVRAGNGTLIAARDLGWKEINIVRSELEGAELAAYAIADNRTAELASWSDELGTTIKELLEADIDPAALGFDDSEIAGLLRQFAAADGVTVDDPAKEWAGMPEFTQETEAFYAHEGTSPKSQMIVDMHPDVAKLSWRFGRHHHRVNYRVFAGNKLVRRKDVKIEGGSDEYGMQLVKRV